MLSSEIIQQIKELQLRTGRQVADVLAGEYISVFKGRGIEFDEVRPYVPGDDVRSIDWNVTARMGSPYIKRYVEERELTILLLVDISASQDFGSGQRSKREAAVELSALLAFTANLNKDKVGLLLFHQGAEEYIPPRKGQKHALRVVREILARGEEPTKRPKEKRIRLPRRILNALLRLRTLTQRASSRQTSIQQALEFCHKVLRRRAVIFLISDFIDEDYLDILRSSNRRHDIISVLVTDPREVAPTNAGLLTLQDAESGRIEIVDTGEKAYREAAARTAKARLEEISDQFKASAIDLIHISTDKPVLPPLVQFFRMRQRRIRR